jgi:hypothetical protein
MFWFNEAVSNNTALLSGKSWLAPDGTKVKAKPVFLTFSFQSTMTAADAQATGEAVRAGVHSQNRTRRMRVWH